MGWGGVGWGGVGWGGRPNLDGVAGAIRKVGTGTRPERKQLVPDLDDGFQKLLEPGRNGPSPVHQTLPLSLTTRMPSSRSRRRDAAVARVAWWLGGAQRELGGNFSRFGWFDA